VNIAEPATVFMLYERVRQVSSWDSTVCSLPLDAAHQSRAFQNLPQDLDPRPHAKVMALLVSGTSLFFITYCGRPRALQAIP
jgi:hypothetical protein